MAQLGPSTVYGSINITGETTSPTFIGNLTGNSDTTTKWATARTITLGGDASGSISLDGSANKTLTVTVSNDSHNHSNSTITSVDASKITSGTISDDRLPSSISSSVTGNAATATKWATARTLTTTLTGAVIGSSSMSVDGSGNKTVTIATTAANDPTLTLSGDASGSATFTNLGDATLNVTVANNSHTHTSANITDATSANTANKIVERDGSGNFSAGTITAALTGKSTQVTVNSSTSSSFYGA